MDAGAWRHNKNKIAFRGQIIMKIRNTLSLCIAISVLAGCSQVNQSIKSVTKLGSQEEDSSYSNEASKLVLPPTLALPADIAQTNLQQRLF